MAERPQLFGTDGVRGIAGRYPLDGNTVWNLGFSLGKVLEPPEGSCRVVLGEDTRESSAWISRTLAAGLRLAGADVLYAGVITTPGVAFLTRHHRLTAGVVVSASHNPYEDNGIKVLSSQGTKLPEALELEIERGLATCRPSAPAAAIPDLKPLPELTDHYVEHLCRLGQGDVDLAGYRVVADCAHGAASRVIPLVLKKLGIAARILNAEPNGRNINVGCGSLHPKTMADETQSSRADLGVAFDGDADRAIFATGSGRIADGDHVLFAVAPHFEKRGLLKGRAVVGTLMTNMALELALAREGIGLKRTAVGDKYVLEEMLRSGINLGGEPSGHLIFGDLSLAGDGIITLTQMLRLMAETRSSLDRLIEGLTLFPQVIRNVRVREKPPMESIPELSDAIRNCRREFGDRGRVVVRYSGTEPLARVMVEGERAEAVERHAARIAALIDAALGTRPVD